MKDVKGGPHSMWPSCQTIFCYFRPRLGDEIPPPADPSVDGKTFTQENQEIERKQQEWLKQKGLE